MKKLFFILFLLCLSPYSWSSIECSTDEVQVEVHWSTMFSYEDNYVFINWGDSRDQYIFDNARVETDFINGRIVKKVELDSDLYFEYYGSVREKSVIVLKRGDTKLTINCDE